MVGMTNRPLIQGDDIRDPDFNNSMQDQKDAPFEGDIQKTVKKRAATEAKPIQLEEA